jgi:two-component system, OmpR family, phosphate regulon sensor histidine kinase PhoR
MGFRTRLLLLTLSVVLLTLVSAYVYLAGQARDDATQRVREETEVRLLLVETRVSLLHASLDDLSQWDALADELGKASEARVTFIRRDGVVLGDSDVSLDRLPQVENHGKRPEVLQALAGQTGFSTRTSTTVDREMLYVARPWFREGKLIGTLRLSSESEEVASTMQKVYRQLTVAGILGLLVAFVGSSITAHFITTSVRRLTAVAQRMASGDLDARGDVDGKDEFSTLALTLNGLAENLNETLEQLRDERDRMTRVLSSMHEGVLLLDQEGRIQLVNAATQEMLLLGSHVIGEKARDVLSDPELIARLQAALDGENSYTELQLGPAGRKVLANVRRLRQRTGALAVLVDITHRRRLETVRQEFVANASHELRTPVTAIISAVETLVGPAAGDQDATSTFVDIIGRNARRLASLVNDLLELSQLESESLKVDCSSLSLRNIVEGSFSSFHGMARQKNIELLCLVPETCRVWANAKGLEHVLGNLLQNAINYCPQGSRVRVAATTDKSEVQLDVADNGPGIAKEHLDRVFERFYRVDTGRSRSVGGTGLGLSIVRHWVEAMGGSVRVTSEVGKGTTFHVALPERPEEPTRVSEPPDSLEATG